MACIFVCTYRPTVSKIINQETRKILSLEGIKAKSGWYESSTHIYLGPAPYLQKRNPEPIK